MAFFKREQGAAFTFTDEQDYNKLYECLTNFDFSKRIEVDIQPTSRMYPAVEILNRIISERQISATVILSELDGTAQNLTSMTSIRQMLIKIGEQSTQLNSQIWQRSRNKWVPQPIRLPIPLRTHPRL